MKPNIEEWVENGEKAFSLPKRENEMECHAELVEGCVPSIETLVVMLRQAQHDSQSLDDISYNFIFLILEFCKIISLL